MRRPVPIYRGFGPIRRTVMDFPYTICFCRCGDSVLMLYRRMPPNAGRWNGLGGKITPDETPFECVRREVLEEADIDLRRSGELRFSGIVTWPSGTDPTSSSTGMYAFVAELPDDRPRWEGEREVDEGLLAWKPLEWVCDPENGAIVSNIPRFLPAMLSGDEPMEYRCDYAGEKLMGMAVEPLPRMPVRSSRH